MDGTSNASQGQWLGKSSSQHAAEGPKRPAGTLDSLDELALSVLERAKRSGKWTAAELNLLESVLRRECTERADHDGTFRYFTVNATHIAPECHTTRHRVNQRLDKFVAGGVLSEHKSTKERPRDKGPNHLRGIRFLWVHHTDQPPPDAAVDDPQRTLDFKPALEPAPSEPAGAHQIVRTK